MQRMRPGVGQVEEDVLSGAADCCRRWRKGSESNRDSPPSHCTDGGTGPYYALRTVISSPVVHLALRVLHELVLRAQKGGGVSSGFWANNRAPRFATREGLPSLPPAQRLSLEIQLGSGAWICVWRPARVCCEYKGTSKALTWAMLQLVQSRGDHLRQDGLADDYEHSGHHRDCDAADHRNHSASHVALQCRRGEGKAFGCARATQQPQR